EGADVTAAPAIEPGDADTDDFVGPQHAAGGLRAGDGHRSRRGHGLQKLTTIHTRHRCCPFAKKAGIPGRRFTYTWKGRRAKGKNENCLAASRREARSPRSPPG